MKGDDKGFLGADSLTLAAVFQAILGLVIALLGLSGIPEFRHLSIEAEDKTNYGSLPGSEGSIFFAHRLIRLD